MNPEIHFLLYRLKNDSRVHLELNIETKYLYQVIINPDGNIYYEVNYRSIDVLPITPKTKKLLKFFADNKNLIMKLLEQANLNKKIDENFNRLWWLLKEETERLELP